MRAHALRHLLVVGLGRGDVRHPAAARLGQLRREPLRVRALAAARAAGDEDEPARDGPVLCCVHRCPPSRRCRSDLPAAVSWLARRPTCRAFPPLGAVASCDVRRRLQLRGSAGLAPASQQLRDARQGYSRGGGGVNRRRAGQRTTSFRRVIRLCGVAGAVGGVRLDRVRAARQVRSVNANVWSPRRLPAEGAAPEEVAAPVADVDGDADNCRVRRERRQTRYRSRAASRAARSPGTPSSRARRRRRRSSSTSRRRRWCSRSAGRRRRPTPSAHRGRTRRRGRS